jgi:hypothetical protein
MLSELEWSILGPWDYSFSFLLFRISRKVETSYVVFMLDGLVGFLIFMTVLSLKFPFCIGGTILEGRSEGSLDTACLSDPLAYSLKVFKVGVVFIFSLEASLN